MKPLRLWPGVLAAVLLVLFHVVISIVGLSAPPVRFLGGLAGGLIVVVWWVFFSRALWSERLGAVALMIVALFATRPFLHPSIGAAGMGMLFAILAVPVMSLALVLWAVASRRLSAGARRVTMVVTILLVCGLFTLVRTEGITGEGDSDFEWRWTPSAEERLLARERPAAPPIAVEAPEKLVSAPATDAPTARAAEQARVQRDAEWPGFRGPKRDGVAARAVRIETDWSRTPPVELWRRSIGPGWSSFAVRGDLAYTQEQRGEHEVVSCFRLTTGEPVWRHRDAVRFYESNGGAGPRATPTVHNGRVYTHGATGIVNALDADSGALVWSRNAAADTGAPLPGWGFASSPLVVNDTVLVAASGRLVGYDAATGNPRWRYRTGGGGYSSPHLISIHGVTQILLLSGAGAASVASDGTLLWQHSWQTGVAMVQPSLVADGEILISGADSMGGVGIRRIAVARGPGGWKAEERWTSRGLKPHFNDYVVHKGHAFGFDGTILSCISLENGERKWKGGRYGAGQMLLLADQDLLLVLSEEGEMVLVSATPDTHTELTRFPALNAKTWNHPVLVGDILLVRNGEEMVAFRLPRATT